MLSQACKGRARGQLRWGNVTQEKQVDTLRLTAVSRKGILGPHLT